MTTGGTGRGALALWWTVIIIIIIIGVGTN
uniref:Uncharacterized protein n=1 Tax=Amphimedon queenslandica TaxID=400682 RepID=A0A1X7V3S6_AMPQE